ncbi:MAG TPA: hypothetical protein VNN22_04695 [Verrucomicrobiae bacterium]|nr:hypothetical protein [Verrucomicrobiae bacterium]
MKMKTKIQRWIPSLFAAVALAGSAGLCQAQSPIVYNFASNLQGWGGNEPSGFPATYTWNATGSSAGGGCMQVTFGGAGTNEMDPSVALPAPLNQAQYLSVSIHMKVDGASGTTGPGGSGGYGNLQAVFRDAQNGSWDSMWYGTLYPPAANNWVTYTFVIAQPYKPAEQYLQFQFQGSAGYSSPVTAYIDNVTITPVPNPWVMDAFTSDTSSSYAQENWTGVSSTSSLNTSQDAGGGFNPVGALQINESFPVAAQWAAWAQSWVFKGQAMDPSRYAFFECDVKVDPTSTPFSSGSDYGAFTIAIRGNGYDGPHGCSPNSIPLTTAAFTSWQHLKLALPTTDSGGNPITNSPGYDIQLIGNYMGPVVLYMDNVQLTKPATQPSITALTKNSVPGGVQINLDANGNSNSNDQEGICTPAATNAVTDFFWINQTPANYSFTLTNFPVPAAPFSSAPTAPASPGAGYDAHIYLCNSDSVVANGQSSSYNQTYSGASYNMVDYLGMHVQNEPVTNAVTYTTNNITLVVTTNNSYGLPPGVVAILDWKTNSPNANATNQIVFHFPGMASANGTWTLSFSDNTHGSIVAANGSVNSFTLPDFSSDPNYTANFTPAASFVHFGIFKNGNTNNNSLGNVFTHVSAINTVAAISDNFSGPGLSANNAWQVAQYYQYAANRVLWMPSGIAWWLKWGLPSGYSVQSAPAITGTWGNAGVTYSYTDSTGTNIFGAVPAASLPVGNAAYFRLVK